MRNSASAVLCKMASEYNERFSYSDPLHRHSSSRTTRYRLRKKRQLSVNTRGPSNKRRSLHGLSEDAASAESLADDLPDVDCTEDVDGRVFPDEIETECENINDSAEDITVDNSDSETEDSSVWQYEFDSDGEGAVGQNTSENDMAVTVLKDQQCMSERAATMLYEGSSLTVACSSIMMMNLKMKHNLTDTCVEDILKLIKFHCPTPNNCVRSVYLLKKFFQESKYPVVYHYYCDKCYTEVCNSDSVCPNMCCKQVMTSNEGKSSFIEVPIEDQLKNLLGRKHRFLLIACTLLTVCNNVIGRGMCELIKDQASFLRSGRSQGSDICGGKLYQELCSKGVMQGNCVALIVNIDGVPVFRSSGYQFWPIFIMICELPYRMRYDMCPRKLIGPFTDT